MAGPWDAFPLVDGGSAEPSARELFGETGVGKRAAEGSLARESTDGTDKWAGFPLAQATPETAVQAVGQGFTAGTAKYGPAVGGMFMGARIGALGGPYAPVTVPLGAATGFGAGLLFGGEIEGILERTRMPSGAPVALTPEKMAPEVRPFGVAGEFVGAGLPFSSIPLGMAAAGARLPPSMVGNWFNKVIDFAERSPGAYATAEEAALVTGGVAGGAAEAFAPGEPGIRLAAELAGGFLAPGRHAALWSTVGAEQIMRIRGLWSPAARETAAGRTIIGIVEKYGDDPVSLATALRAIDIEGLNLTAAQKTGADGLLGIERALTAEYSKFGADAQKAAQEGFATLRKSIVLLRGTGDPASLAKAADLQEQFFRELLDRRVENMTRQAVEAASKIAKDTPEARMALSQTMARIAEDSLKGAREAERAAWDVLPKELEASAGSFIAASREILSRHLPGEAADPVMVATTKALEDNAGRSTLGELLRIRSRFLALARDAKAQNKFALAHDYGELAEATLDDLSMVAAVDPSTGQAIDAARTLSRELNDAFSRTFAGDSLAVARTGARRIPPELLMTRALEGAEEATALRFRQLEEAAAFLPKRGLGGEAAAENLATMLDAQERALRLAASKAVNPNTGRASADSVAKFMRDNPELLERFPAIKNTLEKARTSELALHDLERQVTGQSRLVAQKATFAKLVKFENPADAVQAAIRGRAPVEELTKMGRLAKSAGEDAIAGLRAAAWDNTIQRAGGAEAFSFEKARKAFLDPIREGQPSLADVLVKTGAIGGDEVTRLNRLLKRAEEIEITLAKKIGPEAITTPQDALSQLVTRIAGSVVGRTALEATAGGGGGPQLIAAGAGSQWAQKVLDKIPQGRVKDVILQAAVDPNFMAMLLEKPKAASEAVKLAYQLHAYVISAGLTVGE